MYNSRSFAEKYTEIHWYIEIPVVINLASSNFCLPTTELNERAHNYTSVHFILRWLFSDPIIVFCTVIA